MKNLRGWIFLLSSLGVLFFYNNCSSGFNVEQGTYALSSQSNQSIQFPELYQKGVALYSAKCAMCHGVFESSTKKSALMGDIFEGGQRIDQMKFVSTMPLSDIEAIAYALNPAGTVRRDEVEVTVTPWEELSEKSCQPTSVARDLNIIDKQQYQNIILDVFNYTVDTRALPDNFADFFKRNTSSGGSTVQNTAHFEQLYSLADAVSSYLQANVSAINNIFGKCDISVLSCQQTNVKRILSLLFRKEVTDTDPDYVQMNTRFASKATFAERLKAISLTALMHPRFLFILEYQSGLRTSGLSNPVTRAVDNYELATRLSFFIWNSGPDETLLTAAKAGTLNQPTQLAAQVQRMLAHTKAQRFIKKFVSEWLKLNSMVGLEKDMTAFTNSSTLLSSMKAETEQFALAHLKKGVDFRNFFTSSQTFVDGTLATHYGISGVSGASFVATTRPQASLHGGILAQASVAAITSTNHTDPIYRGIFNYERFLCGELGTPPDNAGTVTFPGNSKMDQLLGRSQLKSCSVCHAKFEPMGYVAEELSPWGQFRAVDEQGQSTGQTVDWIKSTKISSVKDLGRILSANAQIGHCLSENLVKHALRTALANTSEVDCQNHNILTRAYRSGNSFAEYVESVVLSNLFKNRLEEK